jgi:hypothetical protein
MKDRLPELLPESDDARASVEVRAHVAACPSCQVDLAVLERVHALAWTEVDAVRIAGAIPAYRPASRWRRVAASGQWRAAAVVLVAVGLAVGYGRSDRGAPVDTVLARGAAESRPVLSIGDNLADLSDADLRELAAELGELEAVTSAEPEAIAVPAVGRDGAGSGGSA